ncbi:MAG: hypothetical protein J6Q48_07810 [Bacteroidaceae bacterium]|nr:hypothetical protein [Bacteroidaceae bacterium]
MVVTLVNRTNPVDKWQIRILERNVPSQSQQTIGLPVPQDFHDYHDYYPELVDIVYNTLSGSEATITQFVACDFRGTSAPAVDHYWEKFPGLWAYKTIYAGYLGGYGGQDGLSSFSISTDYWYVEGSDPDTRWYVKFAPSANSRYIDVQLYDHSLVLQSFLTYTIDADCTEIQPWGYGIPFIKDFAAFKAAASAGDANNQQGAMLMDQETYTEVFDPDSAYMYKNVAYSYSVKASSNYYTWLWYLYTNGGGDDPEPDPPEDPYNNEYPPGEPNPGEGTRPPYDEGDDIPVPALPPFNLSDSGFTSLWIPSRTALGLLATFMWSDNFIDTVVKKLYANPIDVIISLGLVPFDVTPDGTANICVGDHDTGISSAYVDNDCVIIDCGTITVEELKPGGYLNYSPYTKAQLFLPFVGYVDLDVNEIMLSDISVEYHVCLTNGSFVAFIVNQNVNTTKVIGQYEGNCKIQIPVTSADYSQMWSAIVGTLTAPLASAAGAAAGGAIAGQYIGASAALTSDFAAEGANQGLSSSIASGIANSSNLLEEKLSPQVQRGGAFSSSSGAMGNRKPYIILKSPEVKQPSNYNKYRGYPLQAEMELGSCRGYTEVANILLSLLSASGTETCEVERLLRSGVIFGSGNKPTVGNDGIYLCQNSSPVIQIDKEVSLVDTLTGDFRDSVDMMTPVVRIERSSPLGFNYVYIGEFGRWYFVNKIDVVRTGILDLHLKEDVLESFNAEIKNNTAIIGNNSELYNVYLNDNQLIHTQRDLFWRKEFPTGFLENDNYEWVLLIAGRRATS